MRVRAQSIGLRGGGPLAWLLWLVAGCGPDGLQVDGAGAPSSAADFQVLATQPVAGQADVPRNAPIVVRFSDLPDPAVLSYPYVSIGPRSDPVPVTQEVSLVDREVRFWPRVPLVPRTEIVVQLSRRVHSLSGRQLGTTYRLIFRTGDQVLPASPLPSPPRLADLAGPSGPLSLSCAANGCHRRDSAGHSAAELDLAQEPRALRDHLLSGRRSGLDALLWVEVGRPESSYLLRKLLAAQPGTFVRITGSPMPLSRSPLSVDALRTIEAWIRTGAN